MNVICKLRILKFNILFIIVLSNTLNAQSLQDLELKHGFQDILLDSDISNYSKLVFKKSINSKKSEQPILIYERDKEAYLKIGDVPIKDLEVRTFLGKIIEIKISTPKDTDIMKALKSLYGEPYFSVRSNAWEWKSESVLLSLSSVGKNKLEIIYASRKLNQYIQKEKEEGVENISNDFKP